MSVLLRVDHALRFILREGHSGPHDEAAWESEHRLRCLLEALDRAQVEAAGALISDEHLALRQVMEVIVAQARSLVGARWARLELSQDDLQLEPLAAESMEEAIRG